MKLMSVFMRKKRTDVLIGLNMTQGLKKDLTQKLGVRVI